VGFDIDGATIDATDKAGAFAPPKTPPGVKVLLKDPGRTGFLFLLPLPWMSADAGGDDDKDGAGAGADAGDG